MKKPLLPNKLLVFGVTFILLGLGLLLWNLGYLARFQDQWPILLIFFGGGFLYLVFYKNGSEWYIFLGVLLILLGIFILLSFRLFSETPVERIWPVYMGLSGIAFIPYGFRKRGTSRIAICVPAVSIMFLSVIFLLFSLDLMGITFLRFVRRWWPSLFVITGIILIVVLAYRTKTREDSDAAAEDEK